MNISCFLSEIYMQRLLELLYDRLIRNIFRRAIEIEICDGISRSHLPSFSLVKFVAILLEGLFLDLI
jgi:hypothetical protein